MSDCTASPAPSRDSDGTAGSTDGIKVLGVTDADQEEVNEDIGRISKESENHSLNGTTNDKNADDGSNALAAWFETARRMREESGLKFEVDLRKNKNFRNPAIFEKMIAFCDLDQFGSNINGYIKKDELDDYQFYDNIAEQQRKIASRRAERQSQTQTKKG